jgi:GNAT superfamily N-acetyltransferase
MDTEPGIEMSGATVRRVLPHEYPKYCTHLKALDTESRALRFSSPITDLVIDQLCNKFEADASHHVLFAIENHQLEFVAIGHIALEDGMELAFSVLKPYQGQGLGNLLLQRCIQYCRTHGILEGCMVCVSTNAAIRHLCNKHGISVENDHGESLAKIKFDPAGIDTFIGETIDNNMSAVDWISKRALLPLTRLHRQSTTQ